jgi:hypothetical protein
MNQEVLPTPAQPHLAARRLYFLLSLSRTSFTGYFRYRNTAVLTAVVAMALLYILSSLFNGLPAALFLLLAALLVTGTLAALLLSLWIGLLPSNNYTLLVDQHGLSVRTPEQRYALADIESITVLKKTPTPSDPRPVYSWGAQLQLINAPAPYYLSSASEDEIDRIITLGGDKVRYQESTWLASRFNVFFNRLGDYIPPL